MLPRPQSPRLVLLCLALAAAAPAAAAAHGTLPVAEAPGESQPALLGLGEQLGRLHGELALLDAAPDAAPDRAFEPRDSVPPMRELCLHARELHRKAERLARARGHGLEPGLPSPVPEPGVEELSELLESAAERLQAARGSETAAATLEVVADTPVQVLAAVRAADRALAELLVEPPSHGDVHHVVTRALAFASAMRVRFPGRRMPLTPPEEEFATSDDVHAALVRCWTQVQTLATVAGLRRVSHDPPAEALEVGAERLHALAGMLGDELEVLFLEHGDPERLPPTRHPGSILTTTLLQRVELLGRQLRELRDLAATRNGLAADPEDTP